MNVKPIVFETNFNGKLDCQYFSHITAAPTKPPSDQDLRNTVFSISVRDKSAKPINAQIVDYEIRQVKDLNDKITLLSHGLTRADFLTHHHITTKGSPAIFPDTQICVYFYKRIDGAIEDKP